MAGGFRMDRLWFLSNSYFLEKKWANQRQASSIIASFRMFLMFEQQQKENDIGR